MNAVLVAILVIGFFLFLFLISLAGLIRNCSPNEVLIFSGRRRREGDRVYGYRIVKGGWGVRWPLIERVDRMDLTNLVIDLVAQDAFAKGGVPLTVHGMANVKIAGHEPVLNNAIERFLGRSREEVIRVAKSTLEGCLRGILATMTPEQVNEDKILFAERLVQEVEQDMTTLGLVVDTLRIQNVQDEVGYLDSIGRIRSAQVVSDARIAEAKARADAVVNAAENEQRQTEAQIQAATSVAKADAQKRLTDALTRRNAVVAEEQSTVTGLIAQAKAEVDVQKARVEQIRRKLDADVIQPAKAACEAAETTAKATVAPILEDGKARAEALQTLSTSWKTAGSSAREIFLVQKLEPIVRQLTATIGETPIEKVTMIGAGSTGNNAPANWLPMLEQIKQIYGIDVVEKLKGLGERPINPEPSGVASLELSVPTQDSEKA